MTSLETIFNKCEKYNIFLNLDETFCYTPKRITKYDSKYIGSIYSITDINEIAECISEEGSCMLTYVIESKQGKEVKITNIFISLLIEFGFDPYVGDDNTNTVSIIITDKDVLGDDDEDDDEDDDDDGEDDDVDDDEDEEDDDVDDGDVGDDDVDDDVGDDDVDDDVRENDNVDGENDNVDGENGEHVDGDVDGDVGEDVDGDVDGENGGENGGDVDGDVGEENGEDVEEDVEEDENVDDTFEKLKYITTLTKVQLLNLLLENKIYEYQNKNIRKLTKSDLQDCAKESIKLIKTCP